MIAQLLKVHVHACVRVYAPLFKPEYQKPPYPAIGGASLFAYTDAVFLPIITSLSSSFNVLIENPLFVLLLPTVCWLPVCGVIPVLLFLCRLVCRFWDLIWLGFDFLARILHTCMNSLYMSIRTWVIYLVVSILETFRAIWLEVIKWWYSDSITTSSKLF